MFVKDVEYPRNFVSQGRRQSHGRHVEFCTIRRHMPGHAGPGDQLSKKQDVVRERDMNIASKMQQFCAWVICRGQYHLHTTGLGLYGTPSGWGRIAAASNSAPLRRTKHDKVQAVPLTRSNFPTLIHPRRGLAPLPTRRLRGIKIQILWGGHIESYGNCKRRQLQKLTPTRRKHRMTTHG